jgi:hypothetical protein
LHGVRREITNNIHSLAKNFINQNKRVLFIDTINCINPHHKAFQDPNQNIYFNNIFCVRCPMPYDLWARLKTTKNFLKLKKIEVILIPSLSLLFRNANKREIPYIINNILKIISHLTTSQNLITIIGNSPSRDESIMIAFSILNKFSSEVSNGTHSISNEMASL